MTVTETNTTRVKNFDKGGKFLGVTQSTTTTETTIATGNDPHIMGATITTDKVTFHSDGSPETRESDRGSPKELTGKQAMKSMGDDRSSQLLEAATPSFWKNLSDHPLTVGLGVLSGVSTAAAGCATVVGCVPGIVTGEIIISGSVIAAGTNK